jgi:hypothetical protein
MKRVIEISASALAFTSVLALSGSVMAEEPAPAAAPAPAPEPAPAPAPVTVQTQTTTTYAGGGGGGMTLPGAAAPAQAVAGDSDHDQVIGTLGVGYLGMNGMSVDTIGNVVPAPIIGVRYWIDEMIGIDAGLGIGIRSHSLSNNGADVPQASDTAFLLHGGIPLSLASAGHFSFQIVPELNVGFGSRSVDAPPGGTSQSGSGFHFDIGARAGAEIHFGFMGLPKLSLQGSVGLKLASDSVKHENRAPGGTQTNKESQLSFGTTLQDNPWNIFTGNVAALYYF